MRIGGERKKTVGSNENAKSGRSIQVTNEHTIDTRVQYQEHTHPSAYFPCPLVFIRKHTQKRTYKCFNITPALLKFICI